MSSVRKEEYRQRYLNMPDEHILHYNNLNEEDKNIVASLIGIGIVTMTAGIACLASESVPKPVGFALFGVGSLIAYSFYKIHLPNTIEKANFFHEEAMRRNIKLKEGFTTRVDRIIHFSRFSE